MSNRSDNFERFLAIYAALGLEGTAEEIAELLWLADQIPPDLVQRTTSPADEEKEQTKIDPSPPSESQPLISPPLPSEPATGNVTASQPQAAPSTGKGELYPIQAATEKEGVSGRQVRPPGAYALPQQLLLGRSLRPLNQRVPSRALFEMDEAETVDQIAESGDWTPVMKPEPERWLDVALIVDESSSMFIWQRTIYEFKQLLERQGAFRGLSLWGFQAESDQSGVRFYKGIGRRADREKAISPR